MDLAVRCNVTRGMHVWQRQAYILRKNLPGLARALNLPVATLWHANGRRPARARKTSC